MIASRLHWRLLIGTILTLMALAWLAPRWVAAPGIDEKRELASAPAWPRHLSQMRAFRKGADAYVADRFPIRPHLIGLLNRARMLVGVSGSNQVIVGRDGWLFFDDGTHLGAARGEPPLVGDKVRPWLMNLAGRTEALRARNIPYIVVAAPVKETIYPELGPAWYHGPSPNRSIVLLPKLARAAGAGDVVSLHSDVADATRRGFETFSRHDTHWTGYGAYAGYVGLMNHLHALGLTEGPKPISDFVQDTRETDETPRDLVLMLGVANMVHIDYPTVRNPSGMAKRKITYLTAKQDWTAPQVVDTGETGKPVLLMTRDSFSNALLPMLLPHFSRIVLAHNQDGTWRPDLIDRFKPDIVVIEVIEHGVAVSMERGPRPSPEAIARIDHAIATAVPALHVTPTPQLAPPTSKVAAIMASAKGTGHCHLEVATLTPSAGGKVAVQGSGWITELSDRNPSSEGFLALRGPGGVFVGAIQVDKARPDVAGFFKNPFAEISGFVGDFVIPNLPAGAYDTMLYRRTGDSWIGCPGQQSLSTPQAPST